MDSIRIERRQNARRLVHVSWNGIFVCGDAGETTGGIRKTVEGYDSQSSDDKGWVTVDDARNSTQESLDEASSRITGQTGASENGGNTMSTGICTVVDVPPNGSTKAIDPTFLQSQTPFRLLPSSENVGQCNMGLNVSCNFSSDALSFDDSHLQFFATERTHSAEPTASVY